MSHGKQVESDTSPFDTETSQAEPAPPGDDNFVDARQRGNRLQAVQLPTYMLQDMPTAQDSRATNDELRNNPFSSIAKPIIIRCDNEHSTEQVANVSRLGSTYVPVYRMRSRPKGLFLCINNIDFEDGFHDRREGADKDEMNLKTIFYKLGYRVHTFRNQDAVSMRTTITQFRGRSELQLVDSVVIAVMSHGTGSKVIDTQVLGTDNVPVFSHWIIEQFNTYNCPAMRDKPKIFLFQVCRGSEIDYVPAERARKTESDGTPMSDPGRLNGDVFIANATIQGHVAHRHMLLGSWFVQALCRAYTHHACTQDLVTLHQIIDEYLKKCKSDDPFEPSMQTSVYESRGFSKFYFYPGIYN